MISEEEDSDDVSSLAGWMYTDLLLGLMVIFLATITFTPEKTPDKPLAKTSTEKVSTVASKKVRAFEDINFIAEIDNSNIEIFNSQFQTFRKSDLRGKSISIVDVQYIGSYNRETEDPGVGISRALTFGGELEREYPNLFSGVEATAETFASASPKVLIRVTFRQFLD